MKMAIAGSRTITDTFAFLEALDACKFKYDCIIQGGAEGVDLMAKLAAHLMKIPQYEYPADWDDIDNLPEHLIGIRSNGSEYSKIAGNIRNAQMAKDCDCALIIWDGKSKGTYNMIVQCIQNSKPVQVFKLTPFRGGTMHMVEELYDFEF